MKTYTLKTILSISILFLGCDPKVETAYVKNSKAKIFNSKSQISGYLPYGYSIKGAYSTDKFVINPDGSYVQKKDLTMDEKNIKDSNLFMQLKYDTGDMSTNINKSDIKFFRDQITYFEYWRFAPSADMRKIEARGKAAFNVDEITISYSGDKFEGQEFQQQFGKTTAFENQVLRLKFYPNMGLYVEQSIHTKLDKVTCKLQVKSCEIQCNKFIGPLDKNPEIKSRYQECQKADGDGDCDDLLYDKYHGYCIE